MENAQCKQFKELESERDRLKEENGNMDSMYQDRMLDREAKFNKQYEQIRALHAPLVEAAKHRLSLLYELGSPHCNTELALKDIAMVSEELKAALAKVKG